MIVKRGSKPNMFTLMNEMFKLANVRRRMSMNINQNYVCLSGIYPTVSTPFKKSKDESVSWSHLEANLNRLSQIDFKGFVVNGFFGEYPYLTHKERIEIVKTTRKVIGSKKILIAGSSSECLKKTIKICESMKESGADYSLIFTPHYFKKQMTYQALLDYFTQVADKSPIPILLHNIPSVTFIDLPAELILDLAEHPNIVGLKESSHNIAKIACISERIKENPNMDFCVLTGSASFLLDALRVGATGGICALSNILGQELLDLFNLHSLEKKYMLSHDDDATVSRKKISAKANDLQNKLVTPDLSISETFGVPGLKKAMDAHGMYGGPCRLPLASLNDYETNMLRSAFEKNGFKWLLTKKDEKKTQNFA